MVWPTQLRRRKHKHAFEQALDEAVLDPDGNPLLDDAMPLHAATGPAVGSLGDIAVASGYVAAASLARAYGAEETGAEERAFVRPAEAARKLKAALAAKTYTSKDLKKMRRRFAAENHPDKVPPELSAEAVAAMAEVNAAIDRALKRAAPS